MTDTTEQIEGKLFNGNPLKAKTKKDSILSFSGDKVMFAIYVVLILISILSVFSAMSKEVIDRASGRYMPMFVKHCIMIIIGFTLFLLVRKFDIKKFAPYWKTLFYIAIALLVWPLISSYPNISSARWIDLKFISFQPSEIAKYVTVFYLAHLMANMDKQKLSSVKTYFSLLGKLLCVCALVVLPNLSTAIFIFVVGFMVMFVSGVNKTCWFITFLIMVVMFITMMLMIKYSPQTLSALPRGTTWVNRIEYFNETDITKITQRNRALMAISTGGFIGRTFGNTVEASFLDEGHNDFIFAIMLEEGGFMWGLLIVLLYLILVARIFRLSRNSDLPFDRSISFAVGTIIALQTLMNMSVAVGSFPVTGQTLPFISYGGTSFIIASIFLAIIYGITRQKDTPQNNNTDDNQLQEQVVATQEDNKEQQNTDLSYENQD